MEGSNPYLYAILNQVSPNTTIDENSISFLNKLLSCILYELSKLYQLKSGNEHLNDCVKKLLVGELYRHAIREAAKAIRKFDGNLKVEGDFIVMDKETRSKYAGLEILTLVTENFLRKIGYTKLSNYFLIYLTATIEYLCAEILECSGLKSRNKGRNNIVIEDIISAIDADNELKTTMNNVFHSENGSMWHTKCMEVQFSQAEIVKDGLIEKIPAFEHGELKYFEIPNEFLHDNTRYIQNELAIFEEGKLNFDITNPQKFFQKKNELVHQLVREFISKTHDDEYDDECDDEDDDDFGEKIFKFTKSELEIHDKKVIEEYLKVNGIKIKEKKVKEIKNKTK